MSYHMVIKITIVNAKRGLEAKSRRAIDFHEGEVSNETPVQELIRAAVRLNTSGKGGYVQTSKVLKTVQPWLLGCVD